MTSALEEPTVCVGGKQSIKSKDGATQKLVIMVLCTKCYINIREGDDLHWPEDQDGRQWGGRWGDFKEDWEDGLGEVLRDELNFSGEKEKTKHWQ